MKNYWDIQDNNMIFIFQYFIKEINREKNEIITFILAFPICCEVKAKITISCKIEDFWRLIGWEKFYLVEILFLIIIIKLLFEK